MTKKLIITLMLFLNMSIGLTQENDLVDCTSSFAYEHPIPFTPKIYTSQEIDLPIVVDGKLSDHAWSLVDWSEYFQDIEGSLKPVPERRTEIKVVYDSSYLYIGARLQEDHIWGTLQEKDDIIFHDDDFEIFIDPDGDGHNYLEIEINALNTVWDLFLLFPYRVKGKHNHIMNWEIKGLKTAVYLEGSINDPSDQDQFWSVEMAVPWSALVPFASPKDIPREGDYWRINFSRVDWIMDIVEGKYVKRRDNKDKVLPERNWVWSPIGYINMHRPEDWGYLVFGNDQDFVIPEVEYFKRCLWDLYHAVYSYKSELGSFPSDLSCIKLQDNIGDLEIADFKLAAGLANFEISAKYNGELWTINQAGLLQKLGN